MSRIWIKLYLETLDDPKMGRLSDHLWRRCVEFFLLAGKVDKDGLLPTVDEMAWSLRAGIDEVLQMLGELAKVGIVRKDGENWVVVNFRKRQYSESYERVKRYRNAKSNGEGNADEAEKWSTSTSSSNSDSSSSSEEGEGVGEGTKPATDWVPTTPREASQHPYIQIYHEITGAWPGAKNYRNIVDVFGMLEERGLNLREYLPPYWTAWDTRKTKDGQWYQKDSPVWYSEWAMNEKIPKANGHEPQMGEKKDDFVEQLEAKRKKLKAEVK